MKKIFLLLLLTPLVWGGVSFAQTMGPPTEAEQSAAAAEATRFCTTSCGIIDDFQNCVDNLEAAQGEYDTAAGPVNTAVNNINDEINAANKEYNVCLEEADYSKIDDPKKKELADKKCDRETREGYEKFIIAQRTLKAEKLSELDDPAKNLACAKNSYKQAMLYLLGEATSSFDINNLKVGNEHKLDIVNDVKGDTNILNRILKLLTQVIGTFAVLMLIIGAYYMITSQGDESQLQKGKNIFFYTVIGLLIAFMSFIAVQFVISIIFTSTG